MTETKHRIEDALEAVRSAQRDGITTGGGTALLRARKSLNLEFENEGQELGSKILIKALEAPFRQLCHNGASLLTFF